MLRLKLGSPTFPALISALLVAALLGGCNRTPARQAPVTLAPTPTPQVLVSEAGGFTLALPAGWTAQSTPDTPLGTELLLLPPAHGDEAGAAAPAPGRIYFGATRTLDRNAALALLCPDCAPPPPLTESTLNGRPAWTATFATDDLPARAWTFVDNGDVLLFFTLHDPLGDPLTQEALSSVIDSLRFSPIIDRAARAAEMAEAMRAALAQQTAAADEAVTVAAIEEVTWPDLCLGVPLADELCADEETPGYRVTIGAPTGEYRFHFDPVTTQIRLASAPAADIGATLVEWQAVGSPCERALVGTAGVAFGACGSDVFLTGPIMDDARFALLQSLGATLAPFEAETPVGAVRFVGRGPREATPAEQRQIGELAHFMQRQARGAPEAAPILTWRRTGDFAGACAALALYRTGDARATACRTESATDGAEASAATSALDLEELVQLYTWVDLLDDAETELSDEPVNGGSAADAMTIRLTFRGDGLQTPTDRDLAALLHFAATLFAEMSLDDGPALRLEVESGRAEPPAACPPATSETRVQVVPALGFCFLTPTEFTAFRVLPNQVVLAVDSPGNLREPQLSITAEAAAGRTARDGGPPMTDAGAVEQQNVVIAGQPALLFETVATEGAVNPRDAADDRQVIFVDNDTLYRLDFIAPLSAAETASATGIDTLFESIMESFTLLE